MYIHILDFIGTFAFAVFGSNIAIQKKLDLFGIVTASILTAFGGGAIRSLLLGEVPFFFTNNVYIIIVLAGVLFSILTYHYFEHIKKVMLLIDAVGLSTFALIGASAAANAGFGIFAISLLAVINAIGGGIIRDAVIHEIPTAFLEGLYATPALFVGLLYGLFAVLQQNQIFIALLLVLSFAIRALSIYRTVQVWKPSNTPAPKSINKRFNR